MPVTPDPDTKPLRKGFISVTTVAGAPKATEPRQKKPSSKEGFFGLNWKTALIAGVAVVAVISLSTFFFFIQSLYSQPIGLPVVPTVYSSIPSIPVLVEDLAVLDNRTNFLVMGVDESEWDVGRSDTMILVSVPADGEPIVLISIPRDTMVPLSETNAYEKINHLYPWYGPEFATNTVSRLLDIPIVGFVVVNLEGFVKLVNELGGVLVDIGPLPLYYSDPYQDLLINLPAGEHRLDGDQAMHYVRYRNDANADIGRIERQHNFLNALMAEFRTNNYSVTKIPALLTTALNMVTTNIPFNTLLSIAGSVLKSIDVEMEHVVLEGNGLMYNGLAYYILRYEDSLNQIAEALFPEAERYKYVQEHLNEPWVREYEWLRAELYAQALQEWQRNYYGISTPDDSDDYTEDVNEDEDVLFPDESDDPEFLGGYEDEGLLTEDEDDLGVTDEEYIEYIGDEEEEESGG
ncbi:MAG: LCP family protein [Symbiobacteriaceae bacterium]|nr:LCP family protein [Symbiobacteriaceae bacterium]